MRKLVFLFLTFFIFFTAQSQYPITQNLGSDSTLIRLGANYGGAIRGNVVLRGYYDTTAANLVRIAQYAGALIYTTSDNRVWRRNSTNTRWDSFATSAELSYVTGCYGLLNGGIVTWSGVGLVMNVTASYYVINCNYYNADGSLSVTLSTADPTNPRIDVIAVDTSENIVVITGTPGATPVKPQVNPTYQIELTEVYVPAGATTPNEYTYRTVYNENTEWTGGSTLSSGTANFNSTVFPSVGTKNLRISASTIGHVYWDTTGDFLTSNYQSLSLRFSFASNPINDVTTYIYLRDNGVQVTYSLALDGFGYSSVSGINEYNVITIPMSAFTFTSGSTFDGVGLYFGGMGNIVDVDYVQLQTGTNGGGVIGNYIEGIRRLAGSTDVEGLKNGVWQYLFTDSTGGSSLAFTNGLTESGGTVKLGGTLTEQTTIDGQEPLTISISNIDGGQVIVDDGSVQINAVKNVTGNPSKIEVKTDSINILPPNGNLFVDSLKTVPSTTGRKVLIHDTATGKVERVDPSAFGGWGLSGNTITAGANYIGTNNNASFRIHTNNTLTAWFDSLQGRLHLVNGTDPLVSMKQATTNQTWQMRVGHNTGIASSQFNIYDATSGKVRMVINGSGNVGIGTETNIPGVSQLFVYGGQTGGNIDARGDSTSEARDEANIEVEHPDYDGISHTGYGVAMQTNGNVTTGSLLTYPKKNSGQLRFTNETNVIRVIPNRSLRFATNNIERAVIDSNGRVGIGTKLPDTTLHIVGSVKIVDGYQGANKVLTDVNGDGIGRWMTPATVADTSYTTIATYTAGGGFASDTAMCTDSTLFGSFYTGQFDYTIAYVQAVIKGNAGDSIVLKLVYNDTFNVDGTKVNGAGLSVNNRYTGNTFTISTNRTVPANTWLWMKPEAVITGKKPKYISVTLVGYKTYVTP